MEIKEHQKQILDNQAAITEAIIRMSEQLKRSELVE